MGYFYDVGSVIGVVGMIFVVVTLAVWSVRIILRWIAAATPLFGVTKYSEINLSNPLETIKSLSKRAVIPISRSPPTPSKAQAKSSGSQINLLVRFCLSPSRRAAHNRDRYQDTHSHPPTFSH